MNDSICYNVNVIISVINGKGIDYQTNVSGKLLSLFRSGGIIDLVVYPKNYNELLIVLDTINSHPVPYFVLGNGSNTLVRDGGVRGIVISLTALNNVTINSNLVTAECGVKLPNLAYICANHDLSGLERLAGIPCTIGGATIKNAGCFGKEICSSIKEVICLDKVTLSPLILGKDELSYSYRSCNNTFDNLIVVSTKLELDKTKDNLHEIIKHYTARRKTLQPREPSLGSVFLKTETGIGAGYYIDKAGLKGTTIGGAQISKKHANFIINTGNATSSDYLALIDLACSVVKRKFDLSLTKEIDIIGEN